MKNAVLAILLVFACSPLFACTNFCDRGGGLFGRNYDFDIGNGMVIVNKRGLVKRSLSQGHPAQWLARYASITFNQFGRDIPMDGMNERGLVIALAWLDGSRYPAADGRAEVNELEWIQYHLDTSASVEEVIARSQLVRIVPIAVPLHYLVADRDGNAATIEFLDSQLVAHINPASPVIANDSYAASAAYLERLRQQHATPQTADSLDRFARAAMLIDAPAGAHARSRSSTRWPNPIRAGTSFTTSGCSRSSIGRRPIVSADTCSSRHSTPTVRHRRSDWISSEPCGPPGCGHSGDPRPG